MDSQFLPLKLGDIIDTTFRLIGRTIVRNLIIAVVFMGIPVILVTLASRSFYSQIGSEIDIMSKLSSALLLWAGWILFSIASLLAEISICVVIGGELISRTLTVREAIQELFYDKWLYGIGQALLKGLVLAGGAIAFGIVIAIMGVVAAAGSFGAKAVAGLFIVVAFMVFFSFMIFFLIRWAFSLTAVAVEPLGPVAALKKSWNLVKGNWWRTFGILVLLYILTGFAVGIVSTPITFGGMWHVYKNFFSILGSTGGKLSPGQLAQFQRSFGPEIGISIGVSSILSMLITPVFMVVMYFDLRARHNEFPSEETAAGTEPSPATPA